MLFVFDVADVCGDAIFVSLWFSTIVYSTD